MFGWESERVRLAPLDIERHFESAVAWMNDPAITQFLLAGDFPMTKLAEREYFDRVMVANKDDIPFAIETIDGRHIGFSGIHHVSYRHGTATTGSLIGATEFWGQGLGTEAAILRARYAFEVVGLRTLYSSFLEGNGRSERMQSKVGYEVYGVAPKKYWKRGQFRDEILTWISRERFYELHGERSA